MYIMRRLSSKILTRTVTLKKAKYNTLTRNR